MDFEVSNFRRFHFPGAARVNPITILVGENSSGKTSFAAGLRYIFESLSLRGEGSFNKEPFFIGAYDQIAHYRGGKAGRATEFSLALRLSKEEVRQFGRGLHADTFFTSGQEATDCGTKLCFANARSQPVLDKVEFSNQSLKIDLVRNNLPSFKVTKGGTGEIFEIAGQDENLFYKPTSETTDRNSLRPYIGAIQNWIYTSRFMVGRAEREKNSNTPMSRLIDDFLKNTIAANIFGGNIVYSSAPFRTKPERTYSPVEATSSPEGSHIPILLAQAKAFEARKWNTIKATLEGFGIKSGMFKKVDIKRLGNKESDPFQIIIQTSQDRSNLIDVGYGVSQILPLIVETLINIDSRIFIFQQPEVHLHPRAQAELGSYFVDFAQKSKKYVILETHSDFIIDRIKTELRSRKLSVDEMLSVLFFKREPIETSITRIIFDKEGNTVDPPDGYREFFVNEAMKNLGL